MIKGMIKKWGKDTYCGVVGECRSRIRSQEPHHPNLAEELSLATRIPFAKIQLVFDILRN